MESVGVGAAGIGAGDDLGGRRSSAEVEHGAVVHKRENGRALRAPERAANLVTCSGASWGDPGHGSAMAGGEEQSAAVEKEARG